MNRLLYAQCWEDPDTLTQALEIGPQDDVLSIASAGDNGFALSLKNPHSLTLVDQNPVQIFHVELKIRAIQNLDYEEFVAFIGARPCRRRERLYAHLRPFLGDQARSYWDARTAQVERGIIHCGKFENYFSTFRRHVLPLIHGKETVRKLLAASSLEQQRALYDRLWNNRRWRWLFRVFFGEFLLGRLGRDPAFFQFVTLDNVAEELLRRTQRGLTEVPIQGNYFIEYILTGQYSNPENAHPYLRAANFHSLRESTKKIRLFTGKLEEYLALLQPGSLSKFNLSDIFEYMSQGTFELTLRRILNVCRSDSRMAFWTVFVPRALPSSLAGWIHASVSESQKLFAADRGFFYGGFGLWEVARATTGTHAPCRSTAETWMRADPGEAHA